jgi:3-mercaptopyruvate sulfurtransferase SseA
MLKSITILVAGFIVLSGYPGFLTSASVADNHFVQPGQTEVKRMLSKDLKGLLDKGVTVVIVDVRSADDYKNQHITGAISVPLNEVESRLIKLPPETNIVFY